MASSTYTDYVARRTAEGMSKREIIRSLKRYVAREVYRALTRRSMLMFPRTPFAFCLDPEAWVNLSD